MILGTRSISIEIIQIKNKQDWNTWPTLRPTTCFKEGKSKRNCWTWLTKKIKPLSSCIKSVRIILKSRYPAGRIAGHIAEKARHWQLEHHQVTLKPEGNIGWIPLLNRTSWVFGSSFQGLWLEQHQAKEIGIFFVINRSQCCTLNYKIPKERLKTLYETINSFWTRCKLSAGKFYKSIKRASHKIISLKHTVFFHHNVRQTSAWNLSRFNWDFKRGKLIPHQVFIRVGVKIHEAPSLIWWVKKQRWKIFPNLQGSSWGT
jgi:hypothetical protein